MSDIGNRVEKIITNIVYIGETKDKEEYSDVLLTFNNGTSTDIAVKASVDIIEDVALLCIGVSIGTFLIVLQNVMNERIIL